MAELNQTVEELIIDYYALYGFNFLFRGFKCLDEESLKCALRDFSNAIERQATKKERFNPSTSLCEDYKGKKFVICKRNKKASVEFRKPLWVIMFDDGYKNHWVSAEEIFNVPLLLPKASDNALIGYGKKAKLDK